MQDAVLNLCRVKLRDQQRLANGGLREYPNGDAIRQAVPRSGNASGGGQPGSALKCRPGGPDDFIYLIIQPQGWAPLMRLVGREELIDHPDYALPEARHSRLDACFGIIEAWTQKHDKHEAMRILNERDIPCGPVLDMKELLEDEWLAASGTVVEVEHPQRGTFKTVGCPIKLSDTSVELVTPPALGEYTEEILGELLDYGEAEIEAARAEGTI